MLKWRLNLNVETVAHEKYRFQPFTRRLLFARNKKSICIVLLFFRSVPRVVKGLMRNPTSGILI